MHQKQPQAKLLRSFDPRCAIVLAAGEGRRLRGYVGQFRRDGLPKQYVNFIGRRSMLEHTLDRVEKLIPPQRTFTVVAEAHLADPWVRRQLFSRPRRRVVAQPENRDTGPGVLLPLMHLYKRYPDSSVAIFPSDHFIVEEDLFMAHVGMAFHAVELNPSLLVLLGIKPDQPESEYGYILPDGEQKSVEQMDIFKVKRFVEKPNPETAAELILQGGLWNTMVMVARTRTLLDIMRDVSPDHHDAFQQILKAIGRRDERERVRNIYRCLKPMDFCKDLLADLPLRHPSLLSVLSVHGVFWSDWGVARYVENVLKKIGHPAPLYGSDRTAANRPLRNWMEAEHGSKNRRAL